MPHIFIKSNRGLFQDEGAVQAANLAQIGGIALDDSFLKNAVARDEQGDRRPGQASPIFNANYRRSASDAQNIIYKTFGYIPSVGLLLILRQSVNHLAPLETIIPL
jgi:hypothetical protein